jgi:amino acid transporter
MSEEVKDAGLTVPRAVVASFLVNALMGFVILTTFLFCIPNVSDAVNDTNFPGYPFLYVMSLSLSNGAVTGITVVLLVVVLAGNINSVASTARQTFAFARDCGLPFHQWISHVRKFEIISLNLSNR